jgi:putative ABC transport system permease protein
MFGEDATLPDEAVAMIGRIGPVEGVSAVSLTGATVRRTDRIPSGETGGIAVQGADPSLLGTLEGGLATGRFIDDAVGRYPTVVLGALAAERLGITSLVGQPLVWIADRWWAVVGILEPLPLAPEIDRSALVGMDAARSTWIPRPRRPRSMSAQRTSCSTTSDPCCRRRPTPRAPRRCS